MIVKDILLSSNFWVLNKKIVKSLGVECSLFLSMLVEKNKGQGNEWFAMTSAEVEALIGLSNHIQAKLINTLHKNGFIERENKGIPMKRYFKINDKNIGAVI